MAKVQRPSWLSNDIWINQGERYAPTFSLPDGRIYGTVNKRTDCSAANIVGRAGVKGIMDTNAPDDLRFNWIHSNIFQSTGRAPATSGMPGDSLTQADVEFAAQTVPLARLEASEFGEGLYAFHGESQQAQWWFGKRKSMYGNAGRPRFDAGSYGDFSTLQGNPWYDNNGTNISPTSPLFMNRLQSVAGARASCPYFAVLENLRGANVKAYMDTADYARFYYNKCYAIEVMGKGMGKNGGIGPGQLAYIDWGKIEGLDGGHDLHGGMNYYRRISSPAGWFVTDTHCQIDYNWQVMCVFVMGFSLSDGYMAFDTRNRWGTNPNTCSQPNPNPTPENAIMARWEADNGSSPAPVTSDGFPIEPLRWLDAGYEAAYYYSLCNRTEGQPWTPVRYRFEGSETWIEPASDGTTILHHAAGFDGPHATSSSARRGRPDVRARVKNNAVDLWCADASQPIFKHETLIAQVNGQNFQIKKQGSKLALYNETI